MRTNIVIDETLVRQAMAMSGARTKRDAVHQALVEMVHTRRQRQVLDHAGIGWDGDLAAMRANAAE